jgi:phospholipase/carboxylesterase
VREIGFPDPSTFLPTYELLGGWLDALLAAHELPHERLVIGGFSQGTVMSYALGLGAGRPRPAGIIGLSGFIPTVAGFELDLSERTGLPVAIGHGSADPVIRVEWGRDARDRLQAAAADVVYEEHRGGHQIDPRFLARLPLWVAGCTGAPGAVR